MGAEATFKIIDSRATRIYMSPNLLPNFNHYSNPITSTVSV